MVNQSAQLRAASQHQHQQQEREQQQQPDAHSSSPNNIDSSSKPMAQSSKIKRRHQKAKSHTTPPTFDTPFKDKRWKAKLKKAEAYFAKLPDQICQVCHRMCYPEEMKSTTKCSTCPNVSNYMHYVVDPLPECIAALTNEEKHYLSPIHLFSTLHPATEIKGGRRGYHHLFGGVSAVLNRGNMLFWGTLGGLELPSADKIGSVRRENLIEAFKWLCEQNPLFKQMTNNQTRLEFFGFKSLDNPGMLLLRCTSDSLKGRRQMINNGGAIVPAVDPPPQTHDRENQIQRLIAGEILDNVQAHVVLTFQDPHLLGKLFPDIYPTGRGYWSPNQEEGFKTFRKYVKWRLLHEDPRWRRSLRWLAFSFDMIEKHVIHSETQRVARNQAANSSSRNTVANILDSSLSYYNEKEAIPLPTALRTGDSYWNKQRANLFAFIHRYGIPHYFITLTCNEYGWKEMKKLISFLERKEISEVQTIDFLNYPIEVTRHFLRKLNYILTKFVYGRKAQLFPFKVRDWWWRLEAQSRGSLHIHMVLWLIEDPPSDGIPVCAELPPESDPLRPYVVRNQLHECKLDVCSCNCNFVPEECTCTDGYPKPHSESTTISPNGKVWLYKRRRGLEQYIAPYIPRLLPIINSSMDSQRCTGAGLARYLAKYCSKAEPILTFTSDIRGENPSPSWKHILGRRVGIPEMFVHLTGSPITNSSRSVIVVDLRLPSKRTRALKPLSKLRELDLDSDDIFEDGALEKYMSRPTELEDIKLLQYFEEYDILPQSRSSRKKATVYSDLGNPSRRVQSAKKPHVVRVWPYVTSADAEDYFFQLLMLNTTYREMPTLSAGQTYRNLCANAGLLENGNSITVGSRINDQYLLSLMDILENDSQANFTTDEVNKYLSLYCKLPSLQEPDLDFTQIVSQLSDSQYHAYQTITHSSPICAFITGGAGTGKSFLIQALSAYWRKKKIPFRLLASTGIAATNIGGQTVHSFFAIKPNNSPIPITSCHSKPQLRLQIEKTEVFLIDECSLLSAEILTHIDIWLRTIKHKPFLPFGGVTFILVGDFLQLQPPGGRYLFQSTAWKHFKAFILKENHRQQGNNTFIKMLNEIRLGICSEETTALLQSRILSPDNLPAIRLVPKRFMADAYNISRSPSSSIILQAREFKTPEPPRAEDDTKCPLPMELTLWEGAFVMLVNRNLSVQQGLINGATAFIQSFVRDPSSNEVTAINLLFLFPQPSRYQLKRIHWTYAKDGERITRVQFPLQLAYSMTIHKAQGTTLERIYVDLGKNIFAYGQAYVALSRTKSLENLFLLDFKPEHIKADPQAIEFYRNLLSE
jgi:hypothetical protein